MTSSCESCAVALASLRASHGAVKPQNSVLAADGRPRTEAHATAEATTNTVAARASLRKLALLSCVATLTVTVGKLADSTVSALQQARMHLSRHPFLVFSLALIAACSGRDNSSAQAVGDTVGAAHRAVVLVRSPIAYRVVPVNNPGRITGSVQFSGIPPADTTILIPAAQNGCGKALVINLLSRTAGKVAGAVVWLTDVRQGESLPSNRRFQLTNNNCAWDPQVQTAVTGGALNVVNYDPLAERAYATQISTGDTVAVAPFTDDGQVIPYDKLLQLPSVLEFSVESRPMSRAWVVVLDQPYFAITDSHGMFTIDGVPAGVHHVRAWHPMLGVADGTVTVTPDGAATVDLQFSQAQSVAAQDTTH